MASSKASLRYLPANYDDFASVLAFVNQANKFAYKTTAYIFPSEMVERHKQYLYGRYTPKRGGGKSAYETLSTANLLHDVGMPTWPLPVQGAAHESNKDLDQFIQYRMEALWALAGYGFDLVVPQTSSAYNPWYPTQVTQPNPREAYLAEAYAINIEILRQFLELQKTDSNLNFSALKPLVINGKKIEFDQKLIVKFIEGAADRAAGKAPAWLKAKAQEPAPGQYYSAIFQAQLHKRFWRTIAAVVASILLLPFIGLWYYLWQRAKAKEAIREVKMTLPELAKLGEFRRKLEDRAPQFQFTMNGPAIVPNKVYLRKKRTALLKPQGEIDLNAEQTFYTDAGHAERSELYLKRMRENNTRDLDEKEITILNSSTDWSTKLLPTIVNQQKMFAQAPTVKTASTFPPPRSSHPLFIVSGEGDYLAPKNLKAQFPQYKSEVYPLNDLPLSATAEHIYLFHGLPQPRSANVKTLMHAVAEIKKRFPHNPVSVFLTQKTKYDTAEELPLLGDTNELDSFKKTIYQQRFYTLAFSLQGEIRESSEEYLQASGLSHYRQAPAKRSAASR